MRSRRYRNRRIGEFLKELDLTEGRSTGIPKILRAMKANGSPAPEFESDEDRTHFLIRLPIHAGAETQGASLDQPRVQSGVQSRVQSGVQSEQIMGALRESSRSMKELVNALGMRGRTGSLHRALRGLMEQGLLEYTLPGKPRSRLQRYQLTSQGLAVLDQGKGPVKGARGLRTG